MAVIGALADSKHRALFAQDLGSDTDSQDLDSIYFSATGILNQNIVVFPADHSIAHCDEISDWLAHGDGAPGLTKQGFKNVECYGHKEKIDTNEHPSDGGTGAKENDPNG